MVMRAKFPAGSEQEIASIVTVLQTAGYTATQISQDEIELNLPLAPAEEGQQAAVSEERTAAEATIQPQSMDPNLSEPDCPEVPEREFVLAPLFRKIGASVSDRCDRLYRYLHQGLGQGLHERWSGNTQRLGEMGRTLSSHASVCWGRIAQSFASLKRSTKGTALQRQTKPAAPPLLQKEKQGRRPVTVSRRTADRMSFALAGATATASLVIMYLVLTPHRPSPGLNLQTVQSVPKPASVPTTPRSVAPLPAVARTLPKPSPVKSNRRVMAANRGADAEDSAQEVTVRQFPQRRTPHPVQQAARPKHISDLDE